MRCGRDTLTWHPLSQVIPTNGKKGNRFIRNWLDMLSFLLSGLPADGTITAEVAFMFAEWYRPGVKLDYPKGGSEVNPTPLVLKLDSSASGTGAWSSPI